MLLAQASSQEERRTLARTLYRAKRKWLRSQANQRFAPHAMQLGRSDRSRIGGVQWVFYLEGGKTYDVAEWSRSLQHHYSSLYKSQLEDAEQKLARLHSLESACYLDHQAGIHEWIHLPTSVLLDSRHEMAAGKASGPDGVVYEMLSYLELGALETVRVAFENRINCQGGSTSSVIDWLRILVYNIPKCTRAYNMSKWRPLSMTCALSKWYLSCLCHVLKEHSMTPTCDQYGFTPGCQPMQVTEMTRLILERATEWKRPVWICQGDVARAFDHLEHPLVDEALCSRQVPRCLRAALLRELCNITLDVHLQEAYAEGIGLSKGSEQGSTETPWTWNALLDFLLAPTIQRWMSDSLGFCLHDGLPNLSHAIWADDLTWVATSWGEAQSMPQDLTSALGAGYCSWKPDSLAFIASPAAREAMAEMGAPEFLTTEGLGGTRFTFPLVSQMPLLGVLLDGQGSTNTSLEHRTTASQAHLHARKAQLCCKLVPLPKRLARLYATVIQSLLWGSGGWTLTRGFLRRHEAVEMSLL